MRLNGVAAIVTGGASGLGGATAERLVRAGAKVTLFDLNSQLAAAKTTSIGGLFFAVDVTDEVAIKIAIQKAEAIHGVARILVNCAGMGSAAKVIKRDGNAIPLEEFSKIISINLVGTFNVLSNFMARLHDIDLIDEERGVIINTASIAAFDGQIGQAAYAASKGGIVGMTLPLAREFAQYGVRVMTIAPGIFLTPLLTSLPQDAQNSLGKQVPFPSRLGRPDEFAQMVEAIIANPMLNGEVIRLDGAIRMAPK